MSNNDYNYRQDAEDPDYKFKKNFSLPKEYETFLEFEKKDIEKRSMLNNEPMERVARKILRGQTLNHNDLQTWVNYNYLVLPTEDQEIVQSFIWR